jgi:ubiquinone/menaquinone biosynthesis C-methylase UbiE
MDIVKRQQMEIDFWKNSPLESPDTDSVLSVVNKMIEARWFLDCINRHQNIFEKSQVILELGGGQGWSSCIVKKLFPDKKVIHSDISQWAIASLPKWERIFNVKIDQSFACVSYSIPIQESSVDCIFVFAAAHHFAAHRKSLKEIARVLKRGGTCIYMFEPVTPKLFYKPYFWRVNRKRPEVPEDVLVTKKIIEIAESLQLKASIDYFPSCYNRPAFETVYFSLLNKMPFLMKMLPCTANIVFSKPL